MKIHIKYIKNKLDTTPDFINTGTMSNYLTWLAMLDINDNIVKLITPKLLTEKVIYKIYQNIEEAFETITEITPGHIELKIVAHYSSFFLKLENYLIKEELFESCSNLQKFTEIYYKKSPIK